VKRALQLGTGFLVSAVCIFLAVRGLDLSAVGHALGQASYPWLVPALALYFAGVWVRAVRWRALLLPVKDVSSGRLFPVVVIGYMANDVLPFRLGEVARCFVLFRRERIAQSTALGSVFLERVMDGLTMLAFMAVTLPLLPYSAELYASMGFVGVLFAGVTVALVLLAVKPQVALRILDLFLRPAPSGIAARVRGLAVSFINGLGSLGGVGATLRVFGLSCGAWLCEAGMYYTLMYAFPLTPSAPLAILTTAVANLGTLIPSTPGYVGVFDYVGRSVLAQFGIPEEVALAYVLVVHAALIVPVTLLGFYYAAREGLTVQKLTAEATA
jgi:glycosyltransferase 2 family protein